MNGWRLPAQMYKKFSQECDIPVYEPLCRRLLDDGEGDQSEFMSNQQLVIAPVKLLRIDRGT